jgi:molybdopterin synthase catalytic subunit
MTDRFVERIAEQAMVQWPLLDVLVLHRYGQVALGDAIVLIGVWSAHRGAAFEACRFIIEELKHEAPFWKREGVGQTKRWVATNTGS